MTQLHLLLWLLQLLLPRIASLPLAKLFFRQRPRRARTEWHATEYTQSKVLCYCLGENGRKLVLVEQRATWGRHSVRVKRRLKCAASNSCNVTTTTTTTTTLTTPGRDWRHNTGQGHALSMPSLRFALSPRCATTLVWGFPLWFTLTPVVGNVHARRLPGGSDSLMCFRRKMLKRRP